MDKNQENHSRESLDDIIMRIDKSPTVQERRPSERPSPESDFLNMASLVGNQGNSQSEYSKDSSCRAHGLDRVGRDKSDEVVRQVDSLDTNILLARAIQELTANLELIKTGGKHTVLSSFEGATHEDPKGFIREMFQYFENVGITDSHEQVKKILERLRGRAAKWGTRFKLYPVGFGEFSRKFLEFFDGHAVKIELTTRIYSEKQGQKESTEDFIARKRGLAARIDQFDSNNEESLISIILMALRPEIKSRLRGLHFRTLEQLEVAAVQVEMDLEELSANNAKQKFTSDVNKAYPKNPQERRINSEQRENDRRPIQCYICNGPHPARYCPQTIEPGQPRRLAAIEEIPQELFRDSNRQDDYESEWNEPKNYPRTGTHQQPSPVRKAK